MSIVIIGAGEMGYHLARRLSYEKRDVVIIDRDAARVGFVQENLDVKAIAGRGSSPAILTEAGISKASIMVAVTDSDEVNLMACYVAGHLNGFLTKVARIREQDYSDFPEILDKDHLGVELVISPENEAVAKMMQVLKVPGATDVIDFAEGRIELFGIRLQPDSPFVGASLITLREQFAQERFLVPAIFRDSEVVIPRGPDTLKAMDTVYVIASKDTIPTFMKKIGVNSKPLKSFMILGGNPIGIKIAQNLEMQGLGPIRLIDRDPSVCDHVACELNHTMVLRADAVDEEFLRSEGISETDGFIAVTSDDEHNALTALLAKRLGVQRVAALTNKVEYHRLVTAIGVDVVINPRLAGASRILQSIRKGKILSVSMLPGESVEAIELEAMETSELVGKPLRKIRFPAGAILGAVERDKEFFIPNGETVVEPGDRVVIFVRREAIPKVEKLLTVKLDYF